MAKLTMGIKDAGSLLITSRDRRGTIASNIEMHSNPADLPEINSNVNIKNPLGGAEDMMSMAMPFPLSLIAGSPSRVPKQVPLQEYSTFLATAAASLAVTLITTKKD